MQQLQSEASLVGLGHCGRFRFPTKIHLIFGFFTQANRKLPTLGHGVVIFWDVSPVKMRTKSEKKWKKPSDPTRDLDGRIQPFVKMKALKIMGTMLLII